MLYDNAQLARVYLQAWWVTHDDFYRRVAEETLDYAAPEMTHAESAGQADPQGGFYSSQAADSEGVIDPILCSEMREPANSRLVLVCGVATSQFLTGAADTNPTGRA